MLRRLTLMGALAALAMTALALIMARERRPRSVAAPVAHRADAPTLVAPPALIADTKAQPAPLRAPTARRADPLGLVLGALALTLMLLSGLAFRPDRSQNLVEAGALLGLVGALALGAAIALRPGVIDPARIGAAPLRGVIGGAHRLILVGGVVALALVAEMSGQFLKLPALHQPATHLQAGLLALGLVLVTAGLGGLRIPRRTPRIDLRIALALAALTLLALGLRLWQINTSVRFFVDELSFAMAVRELWGADSRPLLAPMQLVASFPYLFPYLQLQTVELFGRGFAGLRGASALLGALTIPALYLLARTWFDRRTALAAALLLATLPPHVHFSRIGLNNIADPLFGVLALGLIGHGLRSGSRASYALGGVALGMTQYFYDGGRLLYPALLIGWLALGALLWRPRMTRDHWHGLRVTLIGALIVAAPIYYTLIVGDYAFSTRLSNHNTGLGLDYWANLGDPVLRDQHIQWKLLPSFLVYFHMAEGSFFYRGQHPLVLTPAVPFLLLGVGLVLWRIRRPGPLLLALWVIGTSLSNNLLVDSLASPRYVVVFPALALLIGWGLRAAPDLALPVDLPGRRALAQGVVVAGAVALGVVLTDYYFNQHLPLYNFQSRAHSPARDGQDAVLRALALPPGTRIHIIGNPPPDPGFTNGFLHFFSDDYNLSVLRPWQVGPAYLARQEMGIDHAFFVEPDDAQTVEALRPSFNLIGPFDSPFDIAPVHQFTLYYAPYVPGESEALRAKLPTQAMLEGNR